MEIIPSIFKRQFRFRRFSAVVSFKNSENRIELRLRYSIVQTSDFIGFIKIVWEMISQVWSVQWRGPSGLDLLCNNIVNCINVQFQFIPSENLW